MPKLSDTERTSLINELKADIKPTDTIFTLLRHRSASGLQRQYDVYVFKPETRSLNDAAGSSVYWTVAKYRLTHSVARLLGYSYSRKHEAITLNGCGFNGAHDIVSHLSSALYGDASALRYEEL